MMQHVYIIVEGPSDELILSNILDGVLGDMVKVHFYIAHGVPGIISSTRPILDLVASDVKVIVVYDADTGDKLRAEERNDFIKSQILNGEVDERVRFIYFVPTIDCCHRYLLECSKTKRKARDEYNATVSKYISEHKDEFLGIEQIQKIIEFVGEEKQTGDR